MKIITLGQLIDSMEKDGYKQATGTLFRSADSSYVTKREEIDSACALGQGMLNLNLEAMRSVPSDPNKLKFGDFIQRVAELNDTDKLPPHKIAKKVREEYKEFLDLKLQTWEWGQKNPLKGSMR